MFSRLNLNKMMYLGICLLMLNCQAQTSSGSKKEKNSTTVTDASSPTSLALPDGTGVIIPSGTLAAGTNVKLKEAAAPSEFNNLANAGISSASLAIEVGLTDSDGNDIQSVDTPVLVTIPAKDLSLTLTDSGYNLLGSSSELCAVLKAYDNSLLLWRNSLLTYDTTSKNVKFLTKKFGKFQLMFCGDKTVAGFEEVGDTDLSSVSSWEQKTQIDSSTGTTVSSDLSFKFTVVKSYLGDNAKVCMMFVRTQRNPLTYDPANDPNHDGGGDVDIILGSSEVTLSADSVLGTLNYSSKNLVTGGGAYLALFTQDSPDNCSITTGSNVESSLDSGSFKFNELYAFFMSSEDLKAGGSGTLGAAGFSMHKITINTGMSTLPSNPLSTLGGSADFTSILKNQFGFTTEHTACLSLGDKSDGPNTNGAVFQKTVTLLADTIDGAASLEVYAPSVLESFTATDVSIEVGRTCMKDESDSNTSSEFGEDAASYRLRVASVPEDSAVYIAPAQLKVTSTTLSTSNGVCFAIYRSDSFSGSPSTGFEYHKYDQAYKIKLGTKYNVYTMLEDPDNYSSVEPYDGILFPSCGFHSGDVGGTYDNHSYDLTFNWSLTN